MPYNDITDTFRKITREKEHDLSDVKPRKVTPKVSRTDAGHEGQVHIGKEYINEAYVILNHIHTLTRMLANIRKPYLNVDSRTIYASRQTSRNIDLNDGDSSWAGIRHFTNEERDQIDLQARVIITRCADRVKEMETIEKRRVELIANKTTSLARLLPIRLRQDTSSISSDFLAAHHSGVTWYLSRRLAEASQTQKEMQEERVKRQLERTRTLGSSAARDVLHLAAKDGSSNHEQSKSKRTGSWLGDASSSLLAATLGATSNNAHTTIPPLSLDVHPPSDEEDEVFELSASQILQFEAENASILQSVQDTLESVQQAESRLMDISALQMELVNHLTRQTELTEQLYEDAIATTSTVEKGNLQLKEAKRRVKDSRLYILIFLIGASMSLLFLHYY
ncbi:Syntaxin-18 [Termitomyces sp. T112]|nr:Syntaxin-18 [Termitomyces sp. T112]